MAERKAKSGQRRESGAHSPHLPPERRPFRRFLHGRAAGGIPIIAGEFRRVRASTGLPQRVEVPLCLGSTEALLTYFRQGVLGHILAELRGGELTGEELKGVGTPVFSQQTTIEVFLNGIDPGLPLGGRPLRGAAGQRSDWFAFHSANEDDGQGGGRDRQGA